MRSSKESLALRDIRDNILLAQQFIAGMSFAEFCSDIKTFYATTRALEIVAEASRRLLPETKNKNSSIIWRDIAGAGNIYRHDYEDVETRHVWDTVVTDLPELLVFILSEIAAGY